jgi:hypothetical protein
MGILKRKRNVLWIAVIAVFAGLGGLMIASSLFGPSIKTYATVAGVDCQSGERLEYHSHAHLSILIQGEVLKVPKDIGVREECLFWLHTHNDSGLIHLEAPEPRDYTLGQFFEIWGQPLSETQLLDRVADSSHQITATVDGEPWEGDPADIVLKDGVTIVLQYGPPFGEPPESPFQ